MEMKARLIVMGMGLLLLTTVLSTGCIMYHAPGGDLGDGEMEDFPTITFSPGKLLINFHDNVTLDNATKVIEDLNSTTPEDVWVDDEKYWDDHQWLVVNVPDGAEEHYMDLFELEDEVDWVDRW